METGGQARGTFWKGSMDRTLLSPCRVPPLHGDCPGQDSVVYPRCAQPSICLSKHLWSEEM